MAISDATARKSSRARSISHSKKAGLQFPIGRIARFLKAGKYAKRISADAPVYLAAVLEYLASEVLELAGDRAKNGKKKRISPTHMNLAVRRDDELLDKVFDKVIIPNAATVPYIQRCLRRGKDKWL